MKKIWSNRGPFKGNIVMFELTDGRRIVGIYRGKKEKYYLLSNSDNNEYTIKPIKYYVYQGRIRQAYIIHKKRDRK